MVAEPKNLDSLAGKSKEQIELELEEELLQLQQLRAEDLTLAEQENKIKGATANSPQQQEIKKQRKSLALSMTKLREKILGTKRQQAEKAIKSRNKKEDKLGVGGIQEKLMDYTSKIKNLTAERATTSDTADMVLLDTEIRNLTRDMTKFANRNGVRVPKITDSEPTATTPVSRANSVEASSAAVKIETPVAASAPTAADVESSVDAKRVDMANVYKTQLGREDAKLDPVKSMELKKKLDKVQQAGGLDKIVKEGFKKKTEEEKRNIEHEKIAHLRMRVLSQNYESQFAKAPLSKHAEAKAPVSPEENMNARIKAWAEFAAANPDAALPGAPVALDTTAETLIAPVQPRDEMQKYLEVCKERGLSGVVGQISKMFPGFKTLPEGQQMLIIQGMNDSMLKDVNERALEKFQQKSTRTNGLGKLFGVDNKFGRFMNTVGNLPTKIFKNYNLAKYRKEDLKAIKGDDPKDAARRALFIQKNLPGLVEVFGKSGVGAYLNPEGDKVIADFAGKMDLKNASPKLMSVTNDFNEMANILAHIPRKNKKEFEAAREKFEAVRGKLLTELEAHEGGIAAAEKVKKSEILMNTMSFLAADPETSDKLAKIANSPAALQAFKTVITERGLMMGGTALARMGAKAAVMTFAGGALAVSSAPIIGAVIGSSVIISGVAGYLNGRKRARKTIEENAELAQSGKGARTGMKQVAMSSVDKNIKRLEKLQNQYLDDTLTPIQKKEILSQIQTVSGFVEAKLDQGQINFGSGHDVFINQNKLMNALHEAQVAMEQLKNEDNIDLIAGGDNRRRQLLTRVGAKRAELIQDEKDAYIASNARKSMYYGALFATAGAAAKEFGHAFNWSEEAVPGQNTVSANPTSAPFDPANPLGLPKAPAPLGPLNGNGSVPGSSHPVEGGTGAAHHSPDQHHGGGHHHTPKKIVSNPNGNVNGIEGRRPGLPTENEVGHFQFTPDEMEQMSRANNAMMNEHINAMDPELTKYFQETPANNFLTINPEAVTNPESLKLLAQMQSMQRELGTVPGPDDTVEKYFAHMIEFKNRIQMMRIHQNAESLAASQAEVPSDAPLASPVSFEEIPNKEITPDDVMASNFSPEEMEIVNRMAHANRAIHVGEYFDKHPRFLNRGARNFLASDDTDFANKNRRELHEYLVNFANETGRLPEKGWSINRYADFADEYYARKSVLEGNITEVPIEPAAPVSTGPLGPEVPEGYFDTPSVPTPSLAPSAAQLEAFKLYNLNSLDHTFSPKELAWYADNSEKIKLGSLEITQSADEHMNSLLTRIFPKMDLWNGGSNIMAVKTMNLQQFMNSYPRDLIKANPAYGELYKVLKVFEKADPQFVNNTVTVEDFMKSIYRRDEVHEIVRTAVLAQAS